MSTHHDRYTTTLPPSSAESERLARFELRAMSDELAARLDHTLRYWDVDLRAPRVVPEEALG